MPLLRARELGDIIEKARVTLAIADAARGRRSRSGAGRPRRRTRVIGAFNSPEPAWRSTALMAAQAGVVHERRDRGRRSGNHRVHVRHDGPEQGHGAHPSRPAGGDRHVRALRAEAGRGRHLHRIAAHRVHVCARRAGAVSDAIRRVDRADRAGVAAAPARRHPEIPRDDHRSRRRRPTGRCCKQAGEFDLTSLRKCVSAGETLPAATFLAWEAATGIRLMDGIGSTEMLHMFIGSAADDAKPGSTGRVVPGYRARVVDDDGHDVPIGTVGRLAVSRPDRMPLSRRPREPAEVRAARLEPDRRRVPAGRRRLLLVRVAHRRHDHLVRLQHLGRGSGERPARRIPQWPSARWWASPTRREDRSSRRSSCRHPACGGTDALARELQEFVKAELAPYKYPRAIEFVAELPRTLTGKLQRYRLRSGSTGPAEPADPVHPNLPCSSMSLPGGRSRRAMQTPSARRDGCVRRRPSRLGSGDVSVRGRRLCGGGATGARRTSSPRSLRPARGPIRSRA